MRQLTVVAFLVLSLLAGAVGLARAQTPEAIPGASVDIIADTTSESGDVGMALYRIMLEPGAEVPEHEHYGAVTWYVESGSVALTVAEGEVWVRCADCLPDATSTEGGDVLVPAGTEVVLEPGDWVFQHDDTVHAYRNAGDTEAVIAASTTYSLEEASPAASPAPPAFGTPTAGGPKKKETGCQGGCL